MIKNCLKCHLKNSVKMLSYFKTKEDQGENVIMKKHLVYGLSLLVLFSAAAKELKITVFGSSTVWGNGLLAERSMAGIIDNYLRDSLSRTVYPEQMKFSSKPVTVKNRKFHRQSAAKISGVNSSVEFDITGRKLVIWQAIARTGDYGVMTVYADGTKANLEACRKAGLMGMAMPRHLGGSTSQSRPTSWLPTS